VRSSCLAVAPRCANQLVECGSKSWAPPISEQASDYQRTRVDKVSAELVTLTYGTIVAQLCKDYEYNYVDVNKQLERMGYNIGIRLIEDFLAKSSAPACTNFREVAEMISKVVPPGHGIVVLQLMHRF
jgi:hypothetical protein